MSPAEIIIGIYEGFTNAIGSGQAWLSRDGRLWKLEWESPMPREGKRLAARYAFDIERLAIDGLPNRWTPEHWGAMLAEEVRRRWGGHETVARPTDLPLRFQDGLDTEDHKEE